MDVLRRAIAQLHDLYRSMTPGSRLMAAMLAVALLVGLGYIGTQQVARPDADLLHGVPVAKSRLPLMEAAFGKAKLKDFAIRGSSIFVPHGQEAKYMEALSAANALPPGLGDAQRAAINGGSFLEIGSHREQQRDKIAKQEAVASAIRSRPGIEDASVIYDENKTNGFQAKVAKAVAYVWPVGSNQLDEATVIDIRNDVVGAYAELKPENVTVSDLNSHAWSGSVGSADEIRYRSTKRDYEQGLKTKILGVLHIPGVSVELNVEFDHGQVVRTTPAIPAANQPNGLGARPANQDNRSGRPEASAQLSNVTAVLDAVLSGSSGESKKTSEPAAPAAEQQVEREGVALTPISARVSVGVPLSYFNKIWQQQNPVEPGHAEKTPDRAALDQIRIQESANIQRCVAPLLPRTKDATSLTDMVTVTAYQEIPTTLPSEANLGWIAWSWAVQSWKILAGIGFALVCLLVLRSMVRAKPADADEPATSIIIDPAPDAATKKAAVAPPHWRRDVGVADRSLREELSELVEEDPDRAANILRNWIGQG